MATPRRLFLLARFRAMKTRMSSSTAVKRLKPSRRGFFPTPHHTIPVKR